MSKRKDITFSFKYQQLEDTDPDTIFLNEHLFYGLTNLNDGFDASAIKYFTEEDFRIVLQRCEKLGIGICGIEPWQNGEYFDCRVCEEFNCLPTDTNWYKRAFEEFVLTGEDLQYAASYHIPESILRKGTGP